MKKWTFAIAAVIIIGFASCLKNDGSVSTPRAGILVDLLSPDAVNTTISLNGNILGSNVSYGSVPNLYNQVTPGTTNVQVYSNSTATLLNSSFNTQEGKYYSVFLVDSVNQMKAIVVTDSVNYPGTTDSVKVRMYNFAPNSVPLSLVIKDTNTFFNPTRLTSRLFETQATANATNIFDEMKAGAYHFQVFTPFNTTTPLADTTITFEGKHIYTLFIKGFYPDSTGTTKLGLGVVRHG